MQQSNIIEVVHGRDCDGNYYWTVKTDETHDCSISYPAGYESPNYPVPAIRSDQQRALSMGLWRWYWYSKGLIYK